MDLILFTRKIINRIELFYFRHKKAIFYVLGFLIFVFLFYLIFWRSPSTFPEDSYYSVKEGSTLSSVSEELISKKYIKYGFWFKSFVVLSKGGSHVVSGDYYFPRRQNVISLALRISGGKYGVFPIKIVVPEGKNVKEIADIFAEKMINFDKDKFIKIATPKEGYLFTDTYLFLPNATETEVFDTMIKTFEEKIKTLEDNLSSFGKPLADIIKMASILEGEARTFETRKIVAGILWKRLSIDMPLQVDTVFKYINGKNSFTLTEDDLKEDSPYNTYTRKGLPPTPISNPGLMAIEASISPTKTDYLYFLTGRDGVMYYAKTYSQHLINKEKYLK